MIITRIYKIKINKNNNKQNREQSSNKIMIKKKTIKKIKILNKKMKILII